MCSLGKRRKGVVNSSRRKRADSDHRKDTARRLALQLGVWVAALRAASSVSYLNTSALAKNSSRESRNSGGCRP